MELYNKAKIDELLTNKEPKKEIIKLTSQTGTIGADILSRILTNPNNFIFNVNDEAYLNYSGQTSSMLSYQNTLDTSFLLLAISKNDGDYRLELKSTYTTTQMDTLLSAKQPLVETIHLGSASSGTLTSEQLSKVVDNPDNVILTIYDKLHLRHTYTQTTSYLFYQALYITSNTDIFNYVVRINISTGTWNLFSPKSVSTTAIRTAWSSSPSNTYVPSEKLVKDTINSISLEPVAKTITANTDYVSSSSLKCYQAGKFVMVFGEFFIKANTTVPSLGKLFTGLPKVVSGVVYVPGMTRTSTPTIYNLTCEKNSSLNTGVLESSYGCQIVNNSSSVLLIGVGFCYMTSDE